MPFTSKAQRGWMYANKPEMAKRWQKHTPKGKKLPKKVKKKDKRAAAAPAAPPIPQGPPTAASPQGTPPYAPAPTPPQQGQQPEQRPGWQGPPATGQIAAQVAQQKGDTAGVQRATTPSGKSASLTGSAISQLIQDNLVCGVTNGAVRRVLSKVAGVVPSKPAQAMIDLSRRITIDPKTFASQFYEKRSLVAVPPVGSPGMGPTPASALLGDAYNAAPTPAPPTDGPNLAAAEGAMEEFKAPAGNTVGKPGEGSSVPPGAPAAGMGDTIGRFGLGGAVGGAPFGAKGFNHGITS